MNMLLRHEAKLPTYNIWVYFPLKHSLEHAYSYWTYPLAACNVYGWSQENVSDVVNADGREPV